MVFMLAADHRPSVKEAFDLLVEALHQRQVVDEKMKQSQRISEGLQQDRELYADLACKYDLRLAKIPHALCLRLRTHSWVACIIQQPQWLLPRTTLRLACILVVSLY